MVGETLHIADVSLHRHAPSRVLLSAAYRATTAVCVFDGNSTDMHAPETFRIESKQLSHLRVMVVRPYGIIHKTISIIETSRTSTETFHGTGHRPKLKQNRSYSIPTTPLERVVEATRSERVAIAM